MPLASRVTATAVAGPGKAVSATAIKNVTGYSVDLVKRLMLVTTQDQPNRQIEYDIAGVTTFTTTITGSDYTLTLS